MRREIEQLTAKVVMLEGKLEEVANKAEKHGALTVG
jgi:hypothetical protein